MTLSGALQLFKAQLSVPALRGKQGHWIAIARTL